MRFAPLYSGRPGPGLGAAAKLADALGLFMPDRRKPRGSRKGRPLRARTIESADPVKSLLRAGHDLAAKHGEQGLQRLFLAAAHSEAPVEWRRILRSKTTQVRRSQAYQQRAIADALAGRRKAAYERLDQAEAILRDADAALNVELSGPTTRGALPLWDWVLRGARDSFHQSAQEVIRILDAADAGKPLDTPRARLRRGRR